MQKVIFKGFTVEVKVAFDELNVEIEDAGQNELDLISGLGLLLMPAVEQIAEEAARRAKKAKAPETELEKQEKEEELN